MNSNCNLELRLGTPSVSYHSSHEYEYDHDCNAAPEKKQLSIFYNGRIATCDVTEIEARAIITLARRELDQETTPGPTATTGLYMKRSLQRFLQKRKTRAQSTSPYTTVRYQYCMQ
ncbi:protein TIFY 5A-like [Primulina huaijiensis]|uniref:protein TIFY 5A-like n=1 Tax=Primulina huaijiensis TaxID=1492673 RepID=UPI003CC6F521